MSRLGKMDHHPCLDVKYIPSGLNMLFESRVIESRRASKGSSINVEACEVMAVQALMSDPDPAKDELQRDFESFSRSNGQEQALLTTSYQPTEDDWLFRARVLWFWVFRRKREALDMLAAHATKFRGADEDAKQVKVEMAKSRKVVRKRARTFARPAALDSEGEREGEGEGDINGAIILGSPIPSSPPETSDQAEISAPKSYKQTDVFEPSTKRLKVTLLIPKEKVPSTNATEKPTIAKRRRATRIQTAKASSSPASKQLIATVPSAAMPSPDSLVADIPEDKPDETSSTTAELIFKQGESRDGDRRDFAEAVGLVMNSPAPVKQYPPPRQMTPKSPPPVWAESRQELCEALPYYRAFQSGLYMYGRVAYGYLLEAFPAPRDIWAANGTVVISHGGGQCIRVLDPSTKMQMTALQADQSVTDARVDTLLHAAEQRTPIVLIAGEGYELLPWKLGCAYVVLGWYWVSATWVEAEPVALGVQSPPDRDYFHRYKIRFDWVSSQGDPWWWNKASPPPAQHVSPIRPRSSRSVSSDLTPPPSECGEDSGTGRLGTDTHPNGLETFRPACPSLFTGLLTPPVTPPEKKSALRPPTQPSVSASPTNRHIPGTGTLCHQSVIASSEDHFSPYENLRKTCSICKRSSIQVYRESWICLHPTCALFWWLDIGREVLRIPLGWDLQYDPRFLRHISSPIGMKPPYSVIPPEPGDQGGVGDRALWQGWVCGDCARANCRYRWEVWECRNCGKQIGRLDPNDIVPAIDLRPARRSLLGDGVVLPGAGVVVSMRRMREPGAMVVSYKLPAGGDIFHITHQITSSADSIFEAYQREAASTTVPLFERRALKTNRLAGSLLAQHFALNSGASYKYIVDTQSLSFEDSPSCVREALGLIRMRVEAVLSETISFNEILSVLYRDGQKMSWHDDGEDDLGPVVASLSLGSSATMSFRPKPGRHEPNQSYHRGKANATRKQNPATVLSLTLSHGDILIMSGRDLQKAYSHRVIPHGFRVAATAREISVQSAGMDF